MQRTDPSLVGPSLFWFWNATPTHQQINEKLDAFLSKGFGSVYVHPMPQTFRPADFMGGMEIEYLSTEFFELIRYTCNAMKLRQMDMWLYDEGGWPSGMAGGKVVAENPDYGVWMLDRVDGEVRPTQLINEITYPDLMNTTATHAFIRHTHEQYRNCIGDEFGRTVRGIFTDEPRLIGRVGTDRIPWSPLLPDTFRSDHGYAWDERLAELFEPAGENPNHQKLHRDYRATVSKLIASNYYQVIRHWCEKNNLLFEGHHSGEDDYARHGQYFGHYLQQARQYHIPGADTIWRQIFPGQIGGNYVQLASSAAWLNGTQLAISESFAVYGAGLTLEQMKWIAAFQIVRGVNKIGAMASLHSVHGARRINVCTDISPATPIWRDIDLWCDFVRDAAQFTLRGTPQVRVGVFYRGELVAVEKADAFNQTYEAICDRLHDQLVNWMFVDVEALRSGVASSDGLLIGEITVSALVVHVDGELDSRERSALESAAALGVRLILVGSVQAAITNSIVLKNIDELDVRSLSTITTDVPLTGLRLLSVRRNDWCGYLFFNQNPHPLRFSFQTREGRTADQLICRCFDGSKLGASEDRITAIGRTVTLNPGEMRAYETGQTASLAIDRPLASTILDLTNGWTIQRDSTFLIGDDVQEIDAVSEPVNCDLGDYSEQDPTFSGSLVYRTRFNLLHLTPDTRVLLDLGKVYYSAEVTCNGKTVGRRAWQPFVFELSAQVKEGANALEIRVTNTLANQWAAEPVRAHDLKLHRNVYLDKVIPYIAESLHCGLAGPVKIEILKPTQDAI